MPGIAGQEYDRRVASVVDELRGIRLFSGLSQRQLKQLAGLAKERHIRPGVVVVKEGTTGNVGCFILVDGEASVSVDGARGGAHRARRPLRRTRPDHRLPADSDRDRRDQPRCYVIAFWDFRRFAKENPDFMWRLLANLAALLTAERERRGRASLLSS